MKLCSHISLSQSVWAGIRPVLPTVHNIQCLSRAERSRHLPPPFSHYLPIFLHFFSRPTENRQKHYPRRDLHFIVIFSATFPTLQLKGSRRFLLPSGTSVCVSTISGTICWGGWFSRQLMRTCNIYTQGWDTSG